MKSERTYKQELDSGRLAGKNNMYIAYVNGAQSKSWPISEHPKEAYKFLRSLNGETDVFITHVPKDLKLHARNMR